MRKPMILAAGLGLAAAAGTLAVLLHAALGSFRISCEACVTYHGRTDCRTAVGPSEEAATRTATDTACAILASGMTEIVECGRTPDRRVSCRPE